MDKTFVMHCVFLAFVILVTLALIGLLVFSIVYDCSATQVDTYTINCEVTQLAYAEETTGRSSSRPAYKMGVRSEDFAMTFDITANDFAQYTIGDVVEVKVMIYEYMDGTQESKYELVK